MFGLHGVQMPIAYWTPLALGVLIAGIVLLLFTFGLYRFLRYHISRKTRLNTVLYRLGEASHLERRGIFRWLRETVDKI